jgi:hypothetical protein
MMKYNVWKSTVTGCIYEIPAHLDREKGFEGWLFLGTIMK